MTNRNREIKIKIISQEDAGQDIIHTLEQGKSGSYRKGLYFKNLAVVKKLLTEKRLELIKIVKEKEPSSIYHLAKLLGRDFKNVYMDLKILKKYGLVDMRKGNKAVEIEVPYKSITISMEV